MAKDLHVPVTLRGNRLEAKAQLGQTVIVKEGPEKYTPVPITPSESQQTIPTKDKQLTADVIVEPIPSEYIIPTGTEVINVTENGTISRDVSAKETVTVNTNVPIPPGYIVPTGNLGITENGQYDVSEKASVTVDVPSYELPSSVIGIDGGSFTFESNRTSNNVHIPHSLGVAPTAFLIWTDDIDITTEANAIIIRGAFVVDKSADGSVTSYLYQMSKNNGKFSQYARSVGANYAAYANADYISYNVASNMYKANTVYKWIAIVG